MLDTSKQTGVYATEFSLIVHCLIDINDTLRLLLTGIDELDKSLVGIAGALDE